MRRVIGVSGLVVYEMLVIVAALYLLDTRRPPQTQPKPPVVKGVRSYDLQPPYCMCHHKTSPHTPRSKTCDSSAGRVCHPEAHIRTRPDSSRPALSR